MKRRLDAVASPRQAADLRSATYILMGLRYDDEALIRTLLGGVASMKESVTYQAIVREGKAEEARRMLLLVGRRKFGDPSPEVQAALDGLVDVNRLEELTVQVIDVAGWHDLLGLPAPQRQSNRRKGKS
jgi:hypothetical protein